MTRVSELQRGTIHRRQLDAAGKKRGWIAHRRETGRLHLLHPDVYLVGRPRLERFAAETAAVLHFAGDAVLAGDSAALLWDIDEPQDGDEVTVAVIGRDARPRPGLKIHRVQQLDPADMARRHGLPVTSPARTIIDRAATVTPLELENDLAEFRRRHAAHVTPHQIEAALARVPANRAGVGAVRALLEQSAEPAATRSRYERRLRHLLRKAQLPLPLTNVKVCGHMVDAVWRERRLVVEFDSYRWHSGRRAFEVDRKRDQDLVAAGYRVIRITARQLDGDPLAVVARIAAALAIAA